MNNVVMPQPELTGPEYFDIEAALSALAGGMPLAFPPFEAVHWGGLTFCLNMARDPIQNAHRRGMFFEAEELEALGVLMPQGAVVLDVGANVGNHALYFATRMAAAKVVVIEPNPLALAPLLANVVVNGLTDVIETRHLGVGLAEVAGGGFGMKRHDRNLGATKMKPGQGDLRVTTGDAICADLAPNLIKIDVEGMEMRVLAGLEATIARTRPLILIEVDDENAEAFTAWCAAKAYVTARTDRHGKKNQNHLIRPKEAKK